MKTKFGSLGALLALLTVVVIMLAPAASQAGDRLQTRDRLQDQLHDCAMVVPDQDQDQLQTRDRLRDRDCVNDLLIPAPPTEENDGNEIRHRIMTRWQYTWILSPGPMFAFIWPGTY